MKYYRLTDAEMSRHPSIHCSGSIRGMIRKGHWGKNDVIVRCGNFYYNMSILLHYS